MRRTYRPRVQAPTVPQFRANREIRAIEVRLVDERGTNVGVVDLDEALRRAEAAEMDLVEVFPLASPPVVKIMNFSQFKYKQDKETQRQKTKQHRQEIKGIRLSLRISDHDQDMRVEQAVRFLDQGHKLKVELPLRGREHQHTDLAAGVVGAFLKKLQQRFELTMEQPLAKQGGRLSLICSSSGRRRAAEKDRRSTSP